MNRFLSSLPARLVRRHLDRLRTSLETLGERLREAVTNAVGEAVANAVREVVRLLVQLPPGPSPVSRVPEVPWEEPKRWERDPYRHPWEDEEEEWQPADRTVPSSTESAALPAPARWSRAAAVGCQAAAWWLRRQTNRFPALTTLGLAVTASLTAYVAGPVVVVGGAGVLGAALALIRLAQGVDAIAAALGDPAVTKF